MKLPGVLRPHSDFLEPAGDGRDWSWETSLPGGGEQKSSFPNHSSSRRVSRREDLPQVSFSTKSKKDSEKTADLILVIPLHA